MLFRVTSTSQTLSIVVVALNEAQGIRPLMASIRKLAKPSSLSVETVLVDGGSADGTVREAREAGFDKVIELPGANIPACRNRGSTEASGQWLAYVDADCEVAEDWLERALPLLRQSGEIVLGWPAEPPEPPTWVQAAWKIHWTTKNPRTEIFDGQPIVRHDGFRLVTTRNMLLSRTVFEKLGGFDEGLATGEDTDFVLRAYLQGIPVIGLPALRVVHRGEPATLGAFFRQQVWHANVRSYRNIVRKTGARVGGNAPVYTVAFAVALTLFVAGIVLESVGKAGWVLLLPLPAVVVLPALLIANRARRLKFAVPLAILYAAYGLARTLDLAGFSRAKKSWKAPSPAAPA